MAGNTTRAEANRSFFVYVTEPNTGIVRRVAVPADMQVGLEGRPAELQLFGRLSLANTSFRVTTGDRGLVNVSNDDTVVSIEMIDVPPSGRINVRLPPTPRDGQLHFVKDASGTASSVPIDVVPDADVLIDGDELQTLSTDYSSMLLVWSAGGWQVLASANTNSGGGGSGASTSASYVTVTSESGLSAERVLAVGTGIDKVDGGANASLTLSIDNDVVATLTGSRFSGPVRAAGGLSGSLQQLDNGSSYLVAGTNITITSQSNGQVVVSSTRAPFSLELSAFPSSTAELSPAKKVGGVSYDPADWTQLTSTSTIVFHMLLETTNPLNPASGSLFRYSGTGAPAVLATVTTTSSVMVERETDVSTLFRPGQPAGIFTVTLNLTTGSTTDYATSTAAWLEFTP